MGYVNPDHRIYNIRRPQKLAVRRAARRALKRELTGQNLRKNYRATRKGWWYA